MADLDPQKSEDFFNQFLDDYFAESDEHLAIIKRDLLNLEKFVGRTIVQGAQLDELLRSFHTIKGTSGMIGLSPVEQLAHELEGYLRALQQKEAPLTAQGLDALIDGTRGLERLISAHRRHQTSPDISRELQALATVATNVSTGSQTPTPKEPDSTVPLQQAEAELVNAEWRFIFVPTPAHAEAGLNVNTIRSRLLEIGEVVRATPLVESGEIAFEFIVKGKVNESDLHSLSALGLTIDSVVPHRPELTQTEVDDSQGETLSPHSRVLTSTSVRVDLARLDRLMLLVSYLVVSRSRLESTLTSLRGSIPHSEWRTLQEISVRLSRQLRDMRNGMMRVRMVPVAEIFERMRFVVRDLAREGGKRVHIELRGQETEIDKYLIERLMDPLLHLVRNAISHGIETEDERLRQHKSPEGHLVLTATTAGDKVVIELADDGQGLDLDQIGARFPKSKFVDENGDIDSNVLLDIISAPGFSTREEADRASGRGVGMDIVRNAIRELDGTISLETESGKGTRFRITLPLTLAIADVLIATIGTQTFAIHQSAVSEIVEIQSEALRVLENNEVILHRDNVLPLVRLSKIFNLTSEQNGHGFAFVVGSGIRATGLVVDKVLGLREVVVRSLGDPLTNVTGIAGATELGDGRPVLMLDAQEILRMVKPMLAAQ